jgi:cytochrome b
MHKVRVWDLPLRLFHWLLAAAVIASLASGQIGGNLMVWHGRLGILIAGLLGFRLAWGLTGSTYARFASFVRGPKAIRDYLRGEWHGLGHNPLGAISVLGLLTAVGLQTAGGLFANDDIAFQGPLYGLVSKEVSDWIAGLHRKGLWLVLLLVGLHLAAIAYYLDVKKDNLVLPMLTGEKEVADPSAFTPASGGGPLALLFSIAVGILSAFGASGEWLPSPPPAPATTPTW